MVHLGGVTSNCTSARIGRSNKEQNKTNNHGKQTQVLFRELIIHTHHSLRKYQA